MIMTSAHFRSQTGIQLKSAFLSKKSSDELIAIHSDLSSLEGGHQPKYDPQTRWLFMLALAGKCQAYLKEKESRGRNMIKPKHLCVDHLTAQLMQQVAKEVGKSVMYGNRVMHFDRSNAIPMGRNNAAHDKVKFELALGGKKGAEVVNGLSLWEAANNAGVKLTGDERQDAYILRSWLKHMARSNQLGRLMPMEYADSEQRKQYLLSFDHITCSQGDAPFDTTQSGVPAEMGAVPFVISEGGEWYAKTGQFFDKKFHHSSFLSGAPVLLAGTMRVAAGKLKYISNNSGHYAPRIADLVNGARQLQHCGLDQASRHNVSVLASDFEGKYGPNGGRYLFPYVTFARSAGAMANPANYAVKDVFDNLYWVNPQAQRPNLRATVGPQDKWGHKVAFP